MKGRPIVLEELERMVAAAPEMEFYLKWLWLSGLGLGKSLLPSAPMCGLGNRGCVEPSERIAATFIAPQHQYAVTRCCDVT